MRYETDKGHQAQLDWKPQWVQVQQLLENVLTFQKACGFCVFNSPHSQYSFLAQTLYQSQVTVRSLRTDLEPHPY